MNQKRKEKILIILMNLYIYNSFSRIRRFAEFLQPRVKLNNKQLSEICLLEYLLFACFIYINNQQSGSYKYISLVVFLFHFKHIKILIIFFILFIV